MTVPAAAAVAAAVLRASRHTVASPAAAVFGGFTAAYHSSSTALLQHEQQGCRPPGLVFLDSLVDYEKRGVPASAGVAAAPASTAAGSSSSSSRREFGNSQAGSSSSSSEGFDLSRMRRLLAAMGNPQNQLSVVHIAGTKGKGSVAAFISGVLRAAGYKVGTYTSPHLFDIRERIVVGPVDAPELQPSSGQGPAGISSTAAAVAGAAGVPQGVPVTVDEFEALAVQAAAAAAATSGLPAQFVHQQHETPQADCTSSTGSPSSMPSHFEAVTAMALQHFVNHAVDITVIETGLGGATDATNVFGPQQLQLAVLTAVGLDHVDALGGSLQSIATAKAGIMKAGVPVVVGRQHTAAPQLSSQANSGSSSGGGGDGGSSAGGSGGAGDDDEVVLRVFRDVASRQDMQCPLILAQEVVQVEIFADGDSSNASSTGISSSSSSSGISSSGISSRGISSSGISIHRGPGHPLARQQLSVTVDERGAAAIAAAAHKASSVPAASPRVLDGPDSITSSSSGSGSSSSSSSSSGLSLPNVSLQLVGEHQADNMQTAVAAALLLAARGWRRITAAAIRQGLQSAWLPGRFQVAQLPGSPTYYVLDGAHTADSASALAHTLRAAFPTQPVVLVVAMAADKEHREVLQALRAIQPKVVVFTSVPIAGSHARSAPPGTLAAHWQAAAMLSTGRHFRCRELIQAGLGAALDKARHELGACGGQGVVLVTGSLHAVAAGLKQLLPAGVME